MRSALIVLGVTFGVMAGCDKPPVATRAPAEASVPAASAPPVVSAPPAPLAARPSASASAAPVAIGDAGAAPVGCGRAKLVEGRTTQPVPALAKPPKGRFYDEPTFHTCVARATSHAAEKIDGFSRVDYSRRQSFNADSTLFFTNSRDGGWYLYDATTLELKKPLTGLSGDAEPQWHPTDPAILYYGQRNGGLEIQALDVRTGSVKPFIDLRGKLPWPKAARAWTKSEGSPSRDARYWGFQVETENFDILGFAVWDAVDKKLLGSVPSKVRPDHVSMSPSGRWLVVSGDGETTAWSRDLTQEKKLRKGGEHSDLAIGPEGHDYYVSIDYGGDGYIFMLDIDTGKRTDLIRTYFNGAATAMHFSGKAYDKPGWVLMSTYNAGGPRQWYMDKVFVMELAAKPRIYELAHHHSDVKEAYFAEPHATVNRTFTRALFDSNWGATGTIDVDAYLIHIPEGAFP